MSGPGPCRDPGRRPRHVSWPQYRSRLRLDESWSGPFENGSASPEACLLPSCMTTTVRGWAAEKDQFPKRDRPKASPLASPQQPMGHVFYGVKSTKNFSAAPLGSNIV